MVGFHEGDLPPQYSLAHLSLLDCSVPELVYIAARSGYDAVSPRLIPMGLEGECPHHPLGAEMRRATTLALRTTGLCVHDIELCRIGDDFDPPALEPAMAAGAEWGARSLIASIWTKSAPNYLVDTFVRVCQLASSYQLQVVLEFVPFSALPSLAEAVELVKQADQPNAGLLLDTLYLQLTHTGLEELSALPAQWLPFIHVSDAPPHCPESSAEMMQLARNARLYPGEGCIDFSALVRNLPPLHYSIELPNQSRVAVLGREEHARRSLIAAKKVLAPLNRQQKILLSEENDGPTTKRTG